MKSLLFYRFSANSFAGPGQDMAFSMHRTQRWSPDVFTPSYTISTFCPGCGNSNMKGEGGGDPDITESDWLEASTNDML